MEFKETDKKLKEFSLKVQTDLKSELLKKGHIETGDLIASVKVSVTDTDTDNKISLNIEANEYIKYLDDGTFLKDFIKKEVEELKKIVSKSLSKDVYNELIKGITK